MTVKQNEAPPEGAPSEEHLLRTLLQSIPDDRRRRAATDVALGDTSIRGERAVMYIVTAAGPSSPLTYDAVRKAMKQAGTY